MEKDQEFLTALGERIRSARQWRNKSQDELAALAEIEQKLISKIEQGINSPSITTLHKIARALEMPLPLLIDVSLPNIFFD